MALPNLDLPTFKLPFFDALESEPTSEGSHSPALDAYIQKIAFLSPNETEEALNKLISSIQPPTSEESYKLALHNIEEVRAYQESKVLQTVLHMKTFDFLEDVCRINQSLNKDFLQKASISETFDYCNEKFNHVNKKGNYIGDHSSDMQIEDDLFAQSSDKLKKNVTFPFWMEAQLEENTGRRDDLSDTFGSELEGSLTPMEDSKSKKFVYYSSNKKVVFGFDKVENLIDDHVIEDSSRDILKEIDHNILFDNFSCKNTGFY